MTTATIDLAEIIQLIPGYDPAATAGDCWFDEAAAQLALDFFPACLTHIEGALAGQPFVLEEWQQAVIANLFGWKRPDATRRYRELFLFVPRKNGKTPVAAGIADFILFCDDEVGQQNLCAAGDVEQAALLFRHAAGMVRQEPELSRRAEIYGEKGGSVRRSIVVPGTKSFLRVISKIAETKHGANLHLGLVDELHVLPSRDLVDVLETSMASANRLQPLLVLVTTSDFDRPSICNEKYDYASKVRDGIIEDPAFLPVIYEADKDDDWTDPAVWAKANPNLGVSVSGDYLRRKCLKAQEVPAFENTFKRLHLNVRTEQAVRLIQMRTWDEGAGALDPTDFLGRECYAGLDLSSTTDITAFMLVFPDDDGGYSVLPHFWIPGDNARKRERQDKVPYETWARAGLIEMTPGNVIDYDRIRMRIAGAGRALHGQTERLEEWVAEGRSLDGLMDWYNIRECAVDRWAATQIITQLDGDGLTMVPFGQGFKSMSAPTKRLLTLILSGKLRHGGHPVLRWMASNVAAESDSAENLKPSKRRSNERIDGIVALIMALGRAIVRSTKPTGSVYDGRGPLRLGRQNDGGSATEAQRHRDENGRG